MLYGGTAVALYLGHRTSVDFDFFRAEPLDKDEIYAAFPAVADAALLQDSVDTLVASVSIADEAVKLSFFGGVDIGRVADPLQTADGVLLAASPLDLLGTKLKAILDRAQARDYQDIAALLRAGVSLASGVAAFRALFAGEPATVLRAIGYFADVPSVAAADRDILTSARDAVRALPAVGATPGSLAVPIGPCYAIVDPFGQ
ncbi:nucleotidyl transferase AbiEii/AbiGii toxin family protein [Rhodoplanes azumiensis]|uniref:Nucleotidyl transferase AbiEii/AbiGii toxin family protein n=1 Tax=Rhodoplanes azumiensis TaxID=1897628 RepID=A0ABW5ALI0_9BRAD